MIPLRDTIPSRHLPVMTWALIGVNLAVFLYQLTLPPELVERLVYVWGMVPARITDPSWSLRVGLPPGAFLTLASSMFLHGGLVHLISNLWILWIFGDNVEDRMGPLPFLAFYLLCGLAAGGVHLLTNLGSTVPTVGASGAIAGVLGAYMLLFPGSRVVTLVPIFFWPLFVEIPALFYLGFWFLTQLLSGTAELAAVAHTSGAGIAWWAHVGGFVAGLLLMRPFLRRRATPRSHPPLIWP